MSVTETRTTLSWNALMKKSRADLAHLVFIYADTNQKLNDILDTHGAALKRIAEERRPSAAPHNCYYCGRYTPDYSDHADDCVSRIAREALSNG